MHNVLQMLETTATRVPNKLAVADPESELTFEQLRDTAQSIGTWLATQGGVQPREAVALYLEKTPLAWAAMLGVVYAGGFYSVIDVRQTQNRVQSICNTLQPTLVLTDTAHEQDAHALLGDATRVVLINKIAEQRPDLALLDAIRTQATNMDPLYVNFTSGSTGTPKGVVAAHRSIMDFVAVFAETFGINESDILANQAPFDFDGSTKDIYTGLLTGATVRLIPRAYFSNPTQLMDYLCACEATTLTWAASALCFVSIMGGLDYKVPTTVRRVMFTGEVMPPKQLAVWQKHLPNARYVNLYGPTEITCNCTYFEVDRVYESDEIIPMGRQFVNKDVFLLNDKDELIKPADAGVVGEVCVAGSCLALGYLGAPDRTAKAFVQNPLNHRWSQTIYRTGDLARYNENGDLVFSSRKDHQIKHLGQRIEMGDIEAAANGVDGVEQSCCLYDNTRKRIVLCYVGTTGRKELKEQLRELLPHFMVPNNTKQLDKMPLTKNGKIDRTVLASLARIKR